MSEKAGFPRVLWWNNLGDGGLRVVQINPHMVKAEVAIGTDAMGQLIWTSEIPDVQQIEILSRALIRVCNPPSKTDATHTS
jgi:hypothetical protein